MSLIDPSELAHRFAYHPPSTDRVVDLHTEVRRRCLELAMWLNENLPAGGCEGAKALDAVDLTCMHANAAIARHANRRDQAVASTPDPEHR